MRLALTGFFIAAACFAGADDAYWSAVGGAGNFANSKNIRMVSENVQITLHDSSMHVRATFNFRNDGKTQMVTTAFPELMVDYQERRATDPITISNFRCWVDGNEVPVRRKSMPLPNISEYSNYSAVWLKEVSFPSHSSRQVVCEYDSRCSLERQYVDSYYVLRSGATWKGSIGDCLLHVDWSHLKGMGTPTFLAASEPIGGGKKLRTARKGEEWAEFHFHNLNPKFDLEMMWPSGFWGYIVNGMSPQEIPLRNEGETQMHGKPDDPALDFDAFANLLGTSKEVRRVDKLFAHAKSLRSIKALNVQGHSVEFLKEGLLSVDGKQIVVRRVPDYSLNGVYVKDLVGTLGGSYKYEGDNEQAEIKIPKR